MLLTIPDAARLLNVKPATVYTYVARGMPHVRLSPRCIRFEEKDVLAWITRCRSTRTVVGGIPSNSAKAGGEFTAFALRTQPKPKLSNGKRNSVGKSSGLTNLVDFPSTAYNKE